MSILFLDTDVDVVKLTLNKKDGSGTSTYYFSTEYYPADALFSGSAVTYPILAEPPACRRSCGVNVAVRHGVSIRLHAHTPLDSVNKTLFDLRTTHEFHNAALEVRYYSKPLDAAVTHSDAVNIRQTLEVVDHRYSQQDNIIEIQARDTWFNDKEFGHRFNAADFANNVDNYENQWKGEVGPVLFGDTDDATTGIVSSICPLYHSELVADGSGNTYQRIYVTAGFSPDNGSGYNKRKIYVRNPFRNLDPRNCLPLSTFNNTYAFKAPYKGPTTLVAGTDQPMYKWRVGCRVSPGTTARLIGGFTVRHTKTGTIPAGAGQLMVTVREFVQLSGSNWTAVGNILAQVAIDPTSIGAAANFNYHLPVPLVLPPNRHYLVYGEWTNTTDTANYPNIKYDTVVTSDPCYTNDQTVSKDAWTETAAQAQIQVWDFGAETFLSGQDQGDYLLWNQRLDNLMPGTNPYQFDGVDFKISTQGLTDATGNLYNAGGIIENPASIVHFALRDSTFGAAVSSTKADYTAIDAVRSTIGSGLKLATAIESEMAVSELVTEVCNQSRLRLYKSRAGKLNLNFPTPIGTTYDFDISESELRGDMQIVSIEDSPETDVVNYIDAVYNPDSLNVNQDAAITRKVKDSRFLDQEYIHDNGSGDSVSDTFRVALSSASKALYGVRAALWKFQWHIRASHLRKVINYYFDRYHEQRPTVTIRVPRKSFYSAVDLFSKGRLKHSLIPGTSGARSDEKGKFRDSSGNVISCHYQGIPITGSSLGTHKGEVLDIVEQGSYMTITVEQMNSFEGYV